METNANKGQYPPTNGNPCDQNGIQTKQMTIYTNQGPNLCCRNRNRNLCHCFKLLLHKSSKTKCFVTVATSFHV